MRFINFQLIAYPELPEDFVQTHKSNWVTADPKLFDPARVGLLYNNAVDLLVAAAESGYDAVGVNEHHNTGYAMTPSPNLLAAQLVRETSDVAVCVLGNTLVQYNPPVRVAEEFAMLDVMSGGRLIAGFPNGTPMDTAYSYGINPSELRDRYREANELITRAWAADEPFEFNGRFTQLRYANPIPSPLQKPRPPIWIPGSGVVETWDFCCDNDYLYAYMSVSGYYKAQHITEGYWDRVRAKGIEPNPFRGAFAVFLAAADSYAEAKEKYGPAAEYFFNRAFHVAPEFGNPPGIISEATLRKMFELSGVSDEELWDFSAPGFDELVEKSFVIAGSYDSVGEQLEALARRTNVGNLVTVTSYGNMPKDVADAHTREVGAKVLPQIRGLFEDEWEHRWWPEAAGLPAHVRNAQVKEAVR